MATWPETQISGQERTLIRRALIKVGTRLTRAIPSLVSPLGKSVRATSKRMARNTDRRRIDIQMARSRQTTDISSPTGTASTKITEAVCQTLAATRAEVTKTRCPTLSTRPLSVATTRRLATAVLVMLAHSRTATMRSAALMT